MVGLLIITHNKVGQALFDAATSVFGSCPIPCKVLAVSQNCEPADLISKAQGYVKELNQGDGVLVVTDMYGSTPSNIATKMACDNVCIITGINLPMLVRIMNYPNLPLKELTDKAVSGGQAGVMVVEQ